VVKIGKRKYCGLRLSVDGLDGDGGMRQSRRKRSLMRHDQVGIKPFGVEDLASLALGD
jgi:hypothetical protein